MPLSVNSSLFKGDILWASVQCLVPDFALRLAKTTIRPTQAIPANQICFVRAESSLKQFCASSRRHNIVGTFSETLACLLLKEFPDAVVSWTKSSQCSLRVEKQCNLYKEASSFQNFAVSKLHFDLGDGYDRSVYGQYNIGTIWKVLRLVESQAALYP